MLGHGEDGQRASMFLEGLLMAQVALVVARLGIPDLMAAGPRPVADLADETGADPDALGRVLAAAAVYGLVRRDGTGRYELTGTGELFRTDVEGSARSLAAGFLGPPMWMVGSNITDVVATGKVNPAGPGGLYEYYGKHPDEAMWFGRAMGRVTTTMVTELVPGSFLQEVPPGDLYVLSQVLHNWDDEQVRAILANCRVAGQPGGSIMVIELMLPDGPEPSQADLMDLIMLTAVGGRERTRAQHEALMAEAGYALVRDTHLARVLPWRILEFRRW